MSTCRACVCIFFRLINLTQHVRLSLDEFKKNLITAISSRLFFFAFKCMWDEDHWTKKHITSHNVCLWEENRLFETAGIACVVHQWIYIKRKLLYSERERKKKSKFIFPQTSILFLWLFFFLKGLPLYIFLSFLLSRRMHDTEDRENLFFRCWWWFFYKNFLLLNVMCCEIRHFLALFCQSLNLNVL